jgi:alcohol dehydrogenase
VDPQSYEIGRVPRTLVGVNSLVSLLPAVESLDGRSVVLIVDTVVASGGYLDRVLAALGSMPSVVHIAPAGEPTVQTVDAAAAVVRTNDGAVVIGGGSALDIAKQAATVGMGSTGVEPYLLCANPLPGRRPIVAIPTTSGTGAEVTRTCIVSDRLGRKMWTWGDEMLPDLVVLDPTAAATMPHAVTVGTGLDAYVHALPSGHCDWSGITCRVPPPTPQTSVLAKQCKRPRSLPEWPSTTAEPVLPTPSDTRWAACTTCRTEYLSPSHCTPR